MWRSSVFPDGSWSPRGGCPSVPASACHQSTVKLEGVRAQKIGEAVGIVSCRMVASTWGLGYSLWLVQPGLPNLLDMECKGKSSSLNWCLGLGINFGFRWSCHSLRWWSLAEGADVGQRIKSSALDMLNLRCSLDLSVKVLSRQLKLKTKSETSTHGSSFQPWNWPSEKDYRRGGQGANPTVIQ